MPKYSIWIDNEEQWDDSVVAKPDSVLEASGPWAAAERYVEDHWYGEGDQVTLIVRNDINDTFLQIHVSRAWKAARASATSFEELCAP